jgi:hypothetical protein
MKTEKWRAMPVHGGNPRVPRFRIFAGMHLVRVRGGGRVRKTSK